MGGRGGKQRVEEVVSSEPRALSAPKGETEATGADADDERRPDTPNEPSNTLQEAARDPAHIHVDPDGGTDTDQAKCIVCESESGAGNEVVGSVKGTRQTVQDEAESVATRREPLNEVEEGSTTARERSTTRADEDDQYHETNVKDISVDPLESPPLDEPANQLHEPQNIELEWEWIAATSCGVGDGDDDTDGTGGSSSDEGARCVPKKPRNTSEHERVCSEQGENEIFTLGGSRKP